MWAGGRRGSLIKLSQILELHTPLVGLHTVAKVDFLSKMIGAKINLWILNYLWCQFCNSINCDLRGMHCYKGCVNVRNTFRFRKMISAVLLLLPKIYFYEQHNFGVKIQKKIDDKVEGIHTLILAQKFKQVDLQVFIKAQFPQCVSWWILEMFTITKHWHDERRTLCLKTN